MNTSPASRPLTTKTIFHVLWKFAGSAGMVLAVVWGLALLAFVLEMFGMKLTRSRLGMESEIPASVAVGVAVAFSLVLVPLIASKLWRGFHLARVGQITSGTVRRRLGVTFHGVDTIVVSYMVDKKAYSAKIGVGLHEFAVGATLPVLYDPARPQCATLQAFVQPVEEADGE